MTDVMMSWGSFKFSVDQTAYDDIKRVTEYEWPSQKLIGKNEKLQFAGFGSDTITINGRFYTAFTGRYGILDDLRTLAAKKKPQLLVAGTGDVLGQFSVVRIEEGASTFYQDGIPRKIEFTVEFKRFGAAKNGSV